MVGWRFENRKKLDKGISRPCGRVFASNKKNMVHFEIPQYLHTFLDTQTNAKHPKNTKRGVHRGLGEFCGGRCVGGSRAVYHTFSCFLGASRWYACLGVCGCVVASKGALKKTNREGKRGPGGRVMGFWCFWGLHSLKMACGAGGFGGGLAVRKSQKT